MAKRKDEVNTLAELLEEETEVKEKAPVKTEPKKKSFTSTDAILCRSVTPGELFVDGPKTGMTYSFSAYGDETEIEYRDLKALVMTKSVNIFGPRFVVQDADFIAEMPQLQDFYSKKFTTKDLKKILTLPVDEMLNAIKNLPESAESNLKSLAATAIDNGSLDSVRKIKALDNLWGTKFDVFSSPEE